MDFFEQQDQAHRQTRKLLFLFLLAVIAIVITVNVSLALIWSWGFGGAHGSVAPAYPRGFFLVNTFVTLLFIAGGTLFETWRLRDGGDAVAKMAGGRLVMPSSTDVRERRLLNIVEEMALASGIACPRVYILDNEDAINAFAAGYHQNEAVVAVTQGTLSRLSRDELQGVIGHEFSHILNGDMRMNIKLIGILFGIQMIAGLGQELLYWGTRFGSSRSRDDKGPPLQIIMLAVGAALFVIGYVGIFFGRLIKSAVSRQREFLADASAVQFTRNPDGIGGALRKIGGLTAVNHCGSRIDNPHAEQLSHLFLGAARPQLLSGLFATHPPLEERLKRVYGRNVAFLDASVMSEDTAAQKELPEGVYGFGARNVEAMRQAAIPPHSAVNMNGAQQPGIVSAQTDERRKMSFSPVLLQAARDTQSACALVYALLFDRNQPEAFVVQQNLISQVANSQANLVQQYLLEIEAMKNSVRLPLLDLAMPALKLLTTPERAQLLSVAAKLIAADQRMTQAEFVVLAVLERRLGPQAGRSVPVRYANAGALRAEVCLLLSLVAHSHTQQNIAEAAFMRAAAIVPELEFSSADLMATASSDFFDVRQALEKIHQLAPLAKPFLIRAMLAAAARAPDVHIEAPVADLLRGVCAAIDAPVPEAVVNAGDNSSN